MQIEIIAEEGCFPVSENNGNAGWDLFAAEDKFIQRDTGELVSLGIQTSFDFWYVALLWDRSGLSSKKDLHRFAGVIDSNYRGTWKVKLFNHSGKHYQVKKGDKIIQVLFQQVVWPVQFKVVDNLPVSERDEKGFGSSGV